MRKGKIMKNKVKVFITVLLALLLSCGCTIAASANQTDTDTVDITEELPVEEVDETEQDNSVAMNIFTRVFNDIKIYATEIFCAMTFVGSVILAYAYKKGLLPLIKGALSSISPAVSSIKERTEANEESSNTFNAALDKRLSDAEGLIGEFTSKIDAMSLSLDEISQSEAMKNDDAQKLKIVVETQIDLLYEIFMTSALPQYEKDAVGERVAKMKEALSTYETK